MKDTLRNATTAVRKILAVQRNTVIMSRNGEYCCLIQVMYGANNSTLLSSQYYLRWRTAEIDNRSNHLLLALYVGAYCYY